MANIRSHAIQLSGPVAMVIAGLFIGNEGMTWAVGENTRDYVQEFWLLMDEILNSILFREFAHPIIFLPAPLQGQSLALRRHDSTTPVCSPQH